MNQSDYDKALLALVLWREARGEGSVGMTAVGCVIRNRVVGGNWAQVMSAKWQFSSITATNDPQLVVWPLPNDTAWQDAMTIAEGIYSGTIADVTGGADHYFNPGVVRPAWAAQMQHTVDIGHHSFFKS